MISATYRAAIPAIIFASFLFGVESVAAREIEICKACPVSSLRAGIDAAENGDILRVRSGVYAEGTLEIHKELTLIGHDYPVVDGQEAGHVFYVRADNVRISGFAIRNSGMSYVSDFAGIRAEHVRDCRFDRNILTDNTYSIYFEKVSNCTIKDNRITGNARNEVTAGNGVHLFYSDHIAVLDNEISKQRDGLYFEFTEDSVVNGNYSHHNLRFGMHFMFSHRNSFEGNIYTDNPTGVAIMYSRKLKVRRNIFTKSKGNSSFGFLIKEITDSEFSRNRLSENTLGIMLNASNRNTFSENDFEYNGWAAEIYTNSYDNRFINNNFVGNNFDIATNSRRNSSHFEGNYWDRYRGYDLTGDRVGDVPYKPVNVFSFWVARFPELAILLNSPVVRFLEIAERFFPVLTPESLEDQSPRMSALSAATPDVAAEISKFRVRSNAQHR